MKYSLNSGLSPNHKQGYFFIALLFLAANCKKSCDTPCNCPGQPVPLCIITTDLIQFQFTSGDGTNLLGGSGKKYVYTDFGFFTLDKSNHKIYASLDPVEAGYQNDTIIAITVSQLDYQYARSFLEVKNHVQDTVDFMFEVRDAGCCGKASTILGTKLNGILLPDARDFRIRERP